VAALCYNSEMPTAGQGTIRLFRFSGVTVFLHWSWFLVALFEINSRAGHYSSIVWNVAEYISLFLIVLMHEFGHSLACRQVGGLANRIILWPMGGVAFVNPPPRPGATLWSIAAGPLVNVLLFPVLTGFAFLARSLGWAHTLPDLYVLLRSVWFINIALLVFNILPIYPLDGGQILRSLLWFVIGRARSLMVATTLGFIGVAGFVILAIWARSIWYAALAIFMLLNCWGGLRHALDLSKLAKLPRRDGFACPNCKSAPPVGENWHCGNCKQPFDIFATQGICPYCASQFSLTPCLECGTAHPMEKWAVPALVTEPR
jgi:Zn-dependent protease